MIKMFKFNNMQMMLLFPLCIEMTRIYMGYNSPSIQTFNYGYISMLTWKCIKC